jgi:hypothetical protein
VAVKRCVFPIRASFLTAANSEGDGGVTLLSTSLSSQLTNVVKAKNNNPIFLKFVFMISNFYKSELIVVSWFSDLVVNSIFIFLYQFRFDIVTLGLKFI